MDDHSITESSCSSMLFGLEGDTKSIVMRLRLGSEAGIDGYQRYALHDDPTCSLGRGFRAHHLGSNSNLCMPLTLKVTAGGTLLLHGDIVVIPIGSELISLAWRSLAKNLTVGTGCETQGMVSKLWLD